MKTASTIIFYLLSHILFAQSADTQTARQILDASIEFSGGAHIASVRSSELSYVLIQPDGSNAIINEKKKTGHSYVQSILSKTHVPQTTFYNGKKVSRVEGSAVTHVSEIDQVEEVKLRTYNQVQYAYKVLGYKLTRLPDRKFQNFDCYVLDATAPNGYVTINFFDKTNYRLLMVGYPNGDKSLMIEYLFQDKILFNSRILNTYADSEEQQELTLQHVKLNVDIAETWFSCPYDKEVVIPTYIREGKFESTSGPKTMFVRNEKSQDYYEDNGLVMRRYLMWGSSDTLGLIDEKALQNKDTAPETEILVRIISFDKGGYVCQWIAGNYTDTQDYKIVK